MQMLQNKEFVDAKVEIFLKQGSTVWAKLAEFPISPTAADQVTTRPTTHSNSRTPSRSPRRGGDHRLQRHRRRHSVLPASSIAASVPDPRLFLVDLARRRRARVLRRHGLRGAGRAAAARGRRVRLSARGVRPARWLSDRLDVVRRGLCRRDGGQRDRVACSISIDSFRVSANSTPFFAIPHAVRRHHRLAADAHGDCRRLGVCVRPHPRRRPGPRRQQRPRPCSRSRRS